MTDPKPFAVLVQRSVVHEARVDVHADNAEEAQERALGAAASDMVLWIQVQDETVAEVSDECPR